MEPILRARRALDGSCRHTMRRPLAIPGGRRRNRGPSGYRQIDWLHCDAAVVDEEERFDLGRSRVRRAVDHMKWDCSLLGTYERRAQDDRSPVLLVTPHELSVERPELEGHLF